MRQCRKYDSEFKRDTVKLILDGGQTVSEVSKSLGIPRNTVKYWLWLYRKDQNNCFPGKGNLKPEDEEVRRIKKELTDIKQERDILKKALAVFSRDVK